MSIHILPGDGLAEQFPKSIAGSKIICRECLIVGDLSGETLPDFWENRAKFLESEYGENSYIEKTVKEFEKLEGVGTQTEVNLWFEYELFCQVNLWFCLYLMQAKGFNNLSIVYPIFENDTEIWNGFATLSESDLEKCFRDRIKLSGEDISTGAKLWLAYKSSDLNRLETFSNIKSIAFPTLEEVCKAEIERKTANRVENSLRQIIENGAKSFSEVFTQFRQIEGVYGFGDSQVKTIYEELIRR